MKTMLFFCLFSPLALTASNVVPLSNFNGTIPQFGLMGEPMPAEFYSTTSAEAASAYADQGNYRGAFQLDSNSSSITITLINDGDYEAAVVITGIKQADDTAKNYLVQVHAFSSLDIDVTELKDFTLVYVTSLTPFQMLFDHAIDQDGQSTSELIVLPAVDVAEENSSACACFGGCRELRITNANGPAQGGSAIGYFCVGARSTHGQVLLELRGYYPRRTDIFHRPCNVISCPSNSSCPSDVYYTCSTTGRRIIWRGMRGAIQFPSRTGTGTCDLPNELCFVVHNGESQRAKWTATTP